MLFPLFANSQGLNNSFDFDQKDIAELFKAEKMEVYKFPILFNKQESTFNYVFYYYKDGKFVDSVNYLAALKEQLPPSVDLSVYLPHT